MCRVAVTTLPLTAKCPRWCWEPALWTMVVSSAVTCEYHQCALARAAALPTSLEPALCAGTNRRGLTVNLGSVRGLPCCSSVEAEPLGTAGGERSTAEHRVELIGKDIKQTLVPRASRSVVTLQRTHLVISTPLP